MRPLLPRFRGVDVALGWRGSSPPEALAGDVGVAEGVGVAVAAALVTNRASSQRADAVPSGRNISRTRADRAFAGARTAPVRSAVQFRAEVAAESACSIIEPLPSLDAYHETRTNNSALPLSTRANAEASYHWPGVTRTAWCSHLVELVVDR